MTPGGRPRLLDLFCCAGGAAMGYHRAGFEVVGVDIRPQPRYPFEFHQADAMDFPTEGFDAIHASPPCQHFSAMTVVSGRREDHPDLLEPCRQKLKATGLPYVIENVVRAPLLNPVVMCGVAMGLTIVDDGVRYVAYRHRLFECSFPIMVPPCACHKAAGVVLGMYGGGTRQDTRKGKDPGGGNTRKANADQSRRLMDMPWATRDEINQAVPPAYTEHIGGYLMATAKLTPISGAAA